MEIFASLGLDATLFTQMGVFLITFIALKVIVFDSYFAAFRERQARTIGQESAAERYLNEARELEIQYSVKAKAVNEQFRTIYEQSRVDATKEYDRLMQEARARSKQMIESGRTEIGKEIQAAREQLRPEAPQITQLIKAKLLGPKTLRKESVQ